MTDTLTRAELEALARPAADEGAPRGYWHGSATSQVEHWKGRALASERRVDALLAELRAHGWRPHT
jgi:hypothetical protein